MAFESRDTNAEASTPVERIASSSLAALVEEGDRTALVRLLEGQSRVLEMIAKSIPLAAVLEELTRVLEEQVEGMACSVFLLSADRKHLCHCVAPNLPDDYIHAIEGAEIGPRAGSCGAAAFLGHSVIVSDIARDPAWTDYKDVALESGLKACWSMPILSTRGDVLGTFAMYHPHP